MHLISTTLKLRFQRAIRNKISSKTKRSHWLEHYLDTHNCESDPHCIALRNNGKLISEKCAQVDIFFSITQEIKARRKLNLPQFHLFFVYREL